MSFVIVVDENKTTQIREVQNIIRNVQIQTVAYVTMPVRSWPTLKKFLADEGTGLSDYLFDSVEEQKQSATYYKNLANARSKIMEELTLDKALLQQRVDNLERQLKQIKANK